VGPLPGRVAAERPEVFLRQCTVQRDLQTATLPGRQRRSDCGRSLLNPYKQRRSYAGRYGLVAAYARRLRQAQGLAPGQRRVQQPRPVVAESPYQLLTPRRATWLVLRRAEQRTAAEAEQVAHLRAQQADVAEAIDLAQDFAALVRQRQPERLDPWLQRATTRALQAVQRFAKGLYQDDNAVKAGVTLPWSTGPVEGHINRLKMLKRQMVGGARLDLLSRRFVHTPGGGRGRAHPGAMAA
jgi:transposase